MYQVNMLQGGGSVKNKLEKLAHHSVRNGVPDQKQFQYSVAAQVGGAPGTQE